MKLAAILAAALLLALLAPAVPAQETGACVGDRCPPGYVACVDAVDPRLGFCVQDPTLYCFTLVWFDQHVGPYHVWASGCTVHVEEEGWTVLA